MYLKPFFFNLIKLFSENILLALYKRILKQRSFFVLVSSHSLQRRKSDAHINDFDMKRVKKSELKNENRSVLIHFKN